MAAADFAMADVKGGRAEGFGEERERGGEGEREERGEQEEARERDP
jgi:hypothetical protein